jgi:hypothetical protein
MTKRPAADERPRPLNPEEIEELRDSLEARQYWRRTRELLSNVSIWSVAVITAVLLVRDQVVDVLRWIARALGVKP